MILQNDMISLRVSRELKNEILKKPFGKKKKKQILQMKYVFQRRMELFCFVFQAAKDKEYLKDPLQVERCNVLESVANELRSYPMFSEMKASDVMVLYGEQQRLLTGLLTQLTTAQNNLCLKVSDIQLTFFPK
jgi:hypothetical protein